MRVYTLRPQLLLLSLLAAMLLAGCADKRPPMLRLGLKNNYAVARLKPLELSSGVEGSAYEWTLLRYRATKHDEWQQKDLLLSKNRDLRFIAPTTGIYELQFKLYETGNSIIHRFTVLVEHELLAYNPFAVHVLDYKPAPAPKVNLYPNLKDAKSYRQALLVCGRKLVGNAESRLTLGGFAGSIDVAFDHAVLNTPGKYDFEILRKPESGVLDDPAWDYPIGVAVAYDANGNGLKDDNEPWYYLASTNCPNPKEHEVSVVYSTNEGKPQYQSLAPGSPEVAKLGYDAYAVVAWTAQWKEAGAEKTLQGYVPSVGGNSYMAPTWPRKSDWQLAKYVSPRVYTQAKLDWEEDASATPPLKGIGKVLDLPTKVVYNAKPEKEDAVQPCGYDIDWAVDANGKKVSLPAIHFVRIFNPVLIPDAVVKGRNYQMASGEGILVQPDISGVRDLSMR